MTTDNPNQLTLFAPIEAHNCKSSVDLFTSDSVISSVSTPISDTIPSELVTFLEAYQNRIWPNEKTRQNSATRIRNFDAHANHSQLGIADITALNIYEWLDAEKARCLTKEGQKGHPKYVSDASINRYASAMSAILTFAVELKLRPDSPKLRYTKEFSRDRYMTDQEISALISHFLDRGDRWMADLVYVGVNTGMRLSEILSLGFISCGKNSHYGEAQVQEDCVYLPAPITKTKEGRYVSVNEDVRDACLRLTKSLGQHFTHRKFYDRWDDARAKIAPQDKDFVFHCLRHTCASRMANDLSINTIIIAEQLGHKSTDTTKKYVHSKPEHRAKFAGAMNMGGGLLATASR